ncbi:hypothetical protein J416_14382 [Gracilibacillus halophilus YIM-C55.5]|uniref:WVELL protein n=1 Tax=Gracilibacillus halophilus YIM-C55.5 TaxID=1308866 RepID=N4W6C0_9BACI|nr:YfhJ family protein [Gracilibacillus halophilus]ENH95758.1 hypothetical protein J416_14382 [Gracilibacillus halophilus YIM-C55.5]
MREAIERLTQELYEKNQSLTLEEARSWVELLWEDFEATRAKAGRSYQGEEVTEKIVRHWVHQYGGKLQEFMKNNPKYQDKIYRGEDKLH